MTKYVMENSFGGSDKSEKRQRFLKVVAPRQDSSMVSSLNLGSGALPEKSDPKSDSDKDAKI